MIILKNLIFSPPFLAGCSVCLGKELPGSNAFLDFFGCIKMSQIPIWESQQLQVENSPRIHSSITTGAPSSTRANTVWAADFVLMFRTVDVDEPVARIGVVLFQTIKP